MSEYLSLKQILRGPKRGHIVYVRTHGVTPSLDGIYQIKKRRLSSNFPYVVEDSGQQRILRKWEVLSLGKIGTPPHLNQ